MPEIIIIKNIFMKIIFEITDKELREITDRALAAGQSMGKIISVHQFAKMVVLKNIEK